MRSVKIIYKNQLSDKEMERLINEISLVYGIESENIMKIIGTYSDDQRIFMVQSGIKDSMELFDYII